MHLLMCRPSYFDIEYEINPWMHKTNQVDIPKALSQWQKLYDSYQEAGVRVSLIDQIKGLPDMTFTANAAIVHNQTVILSHHRYKERQGEAHYFQHWFNQNGYTIKQLSNFQSGEGDALWYRDQLFMGYGFRSDQAAHEEVSKLLNTPVISLRLINPLFYDFDMAFCPIGEHLLYYPGAFDRASQEILKKLPATISVTEIQAQNFICNSVLVGNTLFTQYLDPEFEQTLKKLGITLKTFEMSEFNKSGGGIKCLSLMLA